jgi:antirestriction protein ArdC
MTDRNAQARTSVYDRVTHAIVAAIEGGGTRYRMPWHHDGAATGRPVNAVSGKPYRGANVLMLWAAAETARYPSGRWATYRGWASLGAQVRKGEQATMVLFWKQVGGTDAADDGQSEEEAGGRARFMARGYNVFNAAQVDGYDPPKPRVLDAAERHAGAEAFFGHLDVPRVTGGDAAFYRPSTDTIHMPPFDRFRDTPPARSTGSTGTCPAASARRPTPWRSLSRNGPPPSSSPISASRTSRAPITRPTSHRGSRS